MNNIILFWSFYLVINLNIIQFIAFYYYIFLYFSFSIFKLVKLVIKLMLINGIKFHP